MSFISELLPSKVWIRTYLEEPFEEGVERIKRAIYGKHLHHMAPDEDPISWKDRGVYLLSGLALLTVFLTPIVWIFMQTFGNPTRLARPMHS